MNDEMREMNDRQERSVETVVKYLTEDIERTERSAKRIWILGGLLIFIVTGYMSWVISSVRSTFLEPQALTDVILGGIDESVPQYLEDAKVYLDQQAPLLAEEVRLRIFDLFPEVRVQGEHAIDLAYDMIPVLQGEIEGAIEAHVALHGEEIKAFYASHDHMRAADEVLESVMEAVMDKLDQSLREHTGRNEGLLEIKMASLESLQNINVQLVGLLKKKPHEMSRQERIQRRLIVTWMQALQNHFEDQRIQLSHLMGETE